MGLRAVGAVGPHVARMLLRSIKPSRSRAPSAAAASVTLCLRTNGCSG